MSENVTNKKYVGLFLSGILQSWGAVNMPSINNDSPKTTELTPTKSAVLGLIRSALGDKRGHDSLNLMNSPLHFLTRTDVQGFMFRDYSIAQRTHHGFKAGPTKELPAYALQDSTFVALLGSEDDGLIDSIYKALKKPHWSPFLGRRAYVPKLPIALGIIETDDACNTLKNLPVIWEHNSFNTEKTVKICDDQIISENVFTERYYDSPLSWDLREKRYMERRFSVFYENVSKQDSVPSDLLGQYLELRKRFTQ